MRESDILMSPKTESSIGDLGVLLLFMILPNKREALYFLFPNVLQRF